MKRGILVLILVLLVAAVPVVSQVRFNSALVMALTSSEVSVGLVPAAGIHYRIPLEAFRLYAGFRAVPVEFGLTGYPNFVAEYSLGPVILEGQLGGGVLVALMPGDGAGINAGGYVFPDISVWYPVDSAKSARLGGGLLGNLNFTRGKYSAIPYLGIKLAVQTP